MKKILFTTMLAVCSLSMQAQFSGQGSGTEKDPYQITNADQLFDVRNDLTACYKLMNDIDLGAWIEEDNPTYGWNPIGNATTPFKGSFNGNCHSIKNLRISRSGSDDVGLFGCVVNANIQLVCLVNVNIEGGSNVGGIAGRILEDLGTVGSVIRDNIIVGGIIQGQDAIGGVVGSVLSMKYYDRDYPQYSHNIIGNNVMVDLIGGNRLGGICGVIDGERNSYYTTCTSICVNVTDNSYKGEMIGNNAVGGIIGAVEDCQQGFVANKFWESLESYTTLYRNISQGTIGGETLVGGIVGSYVSMSNVTSLSMLRNNICAADTIYALSGSAYRVTNIAWTNNYASASCIVMINGKQVSVTDDDNNGISYGIRTLKRKNTYDGLEFDFLKQWSIIEGVTFPYNIKQSEPGAITSFEAGSKATICGTASGSGVAYIIIDNAMREAPIIDGKWEMALGNISPGTIAKVSMQTGNNSPSIFLSAIAEKVVVEPTIIAGDANGDGMVDTADVTAIINYILGKPSASFNKENADVTGDGDILIDDAVQTVQMIMDAQ